MGQFTIDQIGRVLEQGVTMKKLSGTGLVVLSFAVCVLGQSFVSADKARMQPFLTGLNNPVLIRNAGDGSKRLFIVQQSGIIKVLQPGSVTPATFIDLSSKILFVGGGDERGLLGLAFHPNFATNGKFYVYYTRPGAAGSSGTTVIAEYRTSAGNANSGDIATERILLTIPKPFANHNGGMIEFGPGGYLYMGTGDGGSGNDPNANAQNQATLLGKMLRIDVNIPDGSPNAYLIPPSNPFVGANTTRCDAGSTTAGNTCQEIWAIGMRNPWRWSFDRGGTNQLWVGDVGQDAIEEIDTITGGANYGWRVYEGDRCTNNDPTLCTTPNPYTLPVFEYSSAAPDPRCAITGGYVYRGTQGSIPQGAYVFGDYCTGEIWTLQGGVRTALGGTRQFLTSFGEDEDGEIYACYSGGQIDKITRAKASADIDGDVHTDISVFRPSEGNWYSIGSFGGVQVVKWGTEGDIPVPKDYDGDNITDLAVFRPSTGEWFIIRSSDGTIAYTQWGTAGDIPVAGDYDGDSKGDVAIWRPSSGDWFVVRSSDQAIIHQNWGILGDRVAPGDFDGDGKFDLSVWRPSTGDRYSINSSNGQIRFVNFGIATDINVSGDFDGDGRTDLAIFRPSTGNWFIVRSMDRQLVVAQWGTNGDRPEAGDYDGDGRDDLAVFRPSTGEWYVSRSSDSVVQFVKWGVGSDLAVPGLDTP